MIFTRAFLRANAAVSSAAALTTGAGEGVEVVIGADFGTTGTVRTGVGDILFFFGTRATDGDVVVVVAFTSKEGDTEGVVDDEGESGAVENGDETEEVFIVEEGGGG